MEKELHQFITNIGINIIATIPVSAKCGDNIVIKVKTLVGMMMRHFANILDTYNINKGSDKLPLRLPIQDIYKIDDRRVIVGRIETES